MTKMKILLVAVSLGHFVFTPVPAGEYLVSPPLLKAAGLQLVWQNALAVKKGEELADLHLVGDRLYAFSSLNYMAGFKKSDGSLIFSRQVARSGLPIFGLELHADRLLSIIGNELVELNPDSGTELASMMLDFGVGLPAVRNKDYYYIAGTDRRVHVMRAEDRVKLYDVAAENDSEVVCVRADSDSMVLATRAGNVISVEPDEPVRQWQFDAGEAVIPPMVKRGGGLYFSSRDTNIYKLDAETGQLLWKYQTDAILRSSCRVTDDVVYQDVYGKGFIAVQADTGKLLWQIGRNADLLAQSDHRTYLTDRRGLLIVMDNIGAKKLYEVNFAAVSRYVANTKDQGIYIGDGSGRIARLQEVE